jgi:hypothetical protein
MDEISNETKMIVASNLTLATLIRELIISYEKGNPLQTSKEAVWEKFNDMLNYLENQ